MIRLPTLNARKVIQALKAAGFEENGQKGSHLYLWHPVKELETCIPIHAGDLKRSLLRAVLQQVHLSEEEFRNLL